MKKKQLYKLIGVKHFSTSCHYFFFDTRINGYCRLYIVITKKVVYTVLLLFCYKKMCVCVCVCLASSCQIDTRVYKRLVKATIQTFLYSIQKQLYCRCMIS